MSKHTPGPWFRGEIRTNVIGHGGIRVARCNFDGGFNGREDEFEAECNARLISAAPELLEALEGLVKNPNSGLHHNIARLAIAKARGEA